MDRAWMISPVRVPPEKDAGNPRFSILEPYGGICDLAVVNTCDDGIESDFGALKSGDGFIDGE
jgi:hypothetical protein